ncbi:hypothetical protein G9P44_004261 [Scheffersomyces stipitis]|nr:hypothetical protein G9P44_004261 [Scheffersomyces stipitis]
MITERAYRQHVRDDFVPVNVPSSTCHVKLPGAGIYNFIAISHQTDYKNEFKLNSRPEEAQ